MKAHPVVTGHIIAFMPIHRLIILVTSQHDRLVALFRYCPYIKYTLELVPSNCGPTCTGVTDAVLIYTRLWACAVLIVNEYMGFPVKMVVQK